MNMRKSYFLPIVVLCMVLVPGFLWFALGQVTNPPPAAAPPNLSATTSGFATATTAGTCVQQTVAVTNSTTSMACTTAPVSTPGVGAVWSCSVTANGTVTVDECAVATSAGGTIAFNVRVIP